MKKTRRKFTIAFKTKVVLEALKERMSMSELGEKFELHPNQITTWKKEFLANAENAFSDGKAETVDHQKEKEELYNQIGKMKVEIDWLKKKVL